MFEISLFIILDSFLEYKNINTFGKKYIDKNSIIDVNKLFELIYIIIKSAIEIKYLIIIYFFESNPYGLPRLFNFV